MIMAQRDRAWWLASLTTVTSVMGGVFGYMIGHFLFEQIGEPIIYFYQAAEKFENMKWWFDEYGLWFVLIASLTPIPYKLSTIMSGVLGLALLPFIIASLVGRASQFFLIAVLIRWSGVGIEPVLHKWIKAIGWVVIALVVIIAYL